MFGPALLINPVTTEGAKQRTVYLPAGSDWIDFWTGERVKGGQSITAEAPLETVPVYARAGSIVPFGPRVESAAGKPDPMDLRVYAGANGDFTLYEDEGDNYDYEHGVYSTIPVHWDDKAGTLTIGDRHGSFPGMLKHRSFRIVSVINGRGTGISPSAEDDATVEYDGKATSVHLRGRP
jgi:alpha-D-xyloside xylohydrolase